MLPEEDPLPRLLLKRRRATKRLEVADLDFHGVTSEELSPAASASHKSDDDRKLAAYSRSTRGQ